MPSRRSPRRLGDRAVALGASALCAASLGVACHDEPSPPRDARDATVGELVFGVVCDRVGAHAVPEDLTGASFRDVCHRRPDGTFAGDVDAAALAAARPYGPEPDAEQARVRARSHARVGALARHRADLIAALDAAIPDAPNDPGPGGCPAPADRPHLPRQLALALGRLMRLTNDGTLPRATQTLAYALGALRRDPGALDALARLGAREGYVPERDALALPRLVLEHPRARELGAALARALGPDADPLARTVDATGRLVLRPARAYARVEHLVEIARLELLARAPEPSPLPLVLAAGPAGLTGASRPRSGLELASELLFTRAEVPEHAPLGERFVVRRDVRGVAALAVPSDTPPFVDGDGDALPDLDALGRFVTRDAPAPTPFPTRTRDAGPRDGLGRALGEGGALLYAYGETTQSLGAAAVKTARALFGAREEDDAVGALLAGLPVLLGERDGAPTRTRSYETPEGQVTVRFDGYRREVSPLLALAHAAGQLLADPAAADALMLGHELLARHGDALARVTAALLDADAKADLHPDATLPRGSTLWDELADVAGSIAAEPSLLEDLLRALADDATAPLGPALAALLRFRDRVGYDPANLNGPPRALTTGRVEDIHVPVDRAAPDAGENRSVFQRVLHLLHDTSGVALCNKPGAVVHGFVYLGEARAPGTEVEADLPTSGVGTYRECEFLKIDDLGRFYLDAVAGRAELVFRDPMVALGTDVRLQERASGIVGFWDPPAASRFRPRPELLHRMAFFDQAGDSPVAEPAAQNPNHRTSRFLRDLFGPNIGTAVCPQRVLEDPRPEAPDRTPDRKVRGLRACAEGDWLTQRHAGTPFALEQRGLLPALAPVVAAFADHGRTDLLARLLSTLHVHWASDRAPATECDRGAPPSSPRRCTGDGLVRHEPLLAEVLEGDLLPASRALLQRLSAIEVPRCAEAPASAGPCARAELQGGVEVASELLRALVDPARAGALGAKDLRGRTVVRGASGGPRTVTPLELLRRALALVDDAFDRRALAEGGDARRARYLHGRSLLVDTVLAVEGAGPAARFRDPAIVAAGPAVLDRLREELAARCPASLAPPRAPCAWARDVLSSKVEEALAEPLVPAIVDLLEAVRQDGDAWREVRALARHLTDPAAPHGALSALLAALHDAPQALADRATLPTVARALAPAFEPPWEDDRGRARGGSVEALLALVTRVVETGAGGDRPSACEVVDPHGALARAVRGLATPAASLGGRVPLDVIVGAALDVNREDPAQTGPRTAADVAAALDAAVALLEDEQSGLEQLYEVVFRGTSR